MRFHSRNFSVAVAGWLLASAVPASADLIQFTFEGTIGTVGPEPLSAPFGSIDVGDPYTLSYVFDSGTTDGDLSGTVGTYDGDIREFSLLIGAFSVTGTPLFGGAITVDDESMPGIETYDAVMLTTAFDIGVKIGLFAGTLDSDALPTNFFVSNFSGFTFFIDDIGEGSAEGNLRSFSSQVVSVVPLPGSALMGVVGFGIVGWLRRRSLT